VPAARYDAAPVNWYVVRQAAIGTGLCAAVPAFVLALPAAAPAATPEPGLWIGTKGNVQQSFTVRAVGSRRVVTDLVLFCGSVGFLSEESLRDPFDARVLNVKRSGVVKGWAGPGEKPVRLGRRSAVVDTYGYTSGGCPESDFKRIRVSRGPTRPIQDGVYDGESDPAYHLSFEVVGGGTLLRDLDGHAGVPDPTTLTGYCGPAGDIGSDARIAADGTFTSDPGPPEGNRDSRLIVTGMIAGGGASGTYSYSAPEHCVGDGPLTGSVAFATTLTQANPHAIPPGSGGEEPEPPVETKPPPQQGYPGPPEGSKDPDCIPSLEVGPIKALAACFVARGQESESAGRVRLNGIDLTPARPGVKIRVNRRTFAVTSTGPVELRIGGLALLRDKLEWRRPDAVFEIDGKSDAKDPGPDFKTKNQNLFGLPVDGSAKLELTDGKTVLTVTVEVPDDGPLPKPLKRLAGYSGELRAAATNESGLVLDGGKLTFPGLRAGFVEIQGAELAISLSGSSYHFDGKATVFPFRFNRIGFEGTLGIGFGDGYFKLGLAAEQLNRALVYGFFLQKVGLELQINPFGLMGSAGVTFGPQFRLGGDLISAARLDGSLQYLSGGDAEPASVELAGALELAEADAADGKVTVKSDATIDAEGTFKFEVAGYGLEGKLDGWFDGLRAFNVEGGVELSIPGPNGSGDAVLSTRGVGACRHGFGPDVGFGYTWGEGIGGVSFVGSSCSVGNWREERSTSTFASAAQAGPLRVPVRRGLRQLAVRLSGAGGPPAVVVTAPDGRQIASVPTPDGVVDERTLLVQDPDTSATYLVVDAPARGRWTIAPQAGPPIAALATAAPLPRVRVGGRVRDGGRRKLLRYRARGLAGRRLQLMDTAGGGHKLIRTTGRARGRIRFTPLPRGGRHRIRALVLGSQGIPTGITRKVATYRAHHGGPPRPRRVRVRRHGGSKIVKWRGPRRLRYEVDVRVTDGRRLRLIARPGRRSVRVGIVPRGVKVRATLRARDATGRAGRAARARG
jgi:hypothetical protein